jgi:membrane protein YdbS with pleckstrin-like domain
MSRAITDRKTLMTSKSLGKIGRRVLWISPLFIAVVGFFGLLLWLKPRNATFVLVLSAVFSIFVMGYADFLARRVGRRTDEVQIASMGFTSFRGWL